MDVEGCLRAAGSVTLKQTSCQWQLAASRHQRHHPRWESLAVNRIGPQPGCYGAWVLCAVPAVLASTCLVTILFSGLGRWTHCRRWPAGPLLLLGPAERVAVGAHCRFRTPTAVEIGWLASLRAWTERRSDAGPGRFDWYVRDDPEPVRWRPAAARSRSPPASCGCCATVR